MPKRKTAFDANEYSYRILYDAEEKEFLGLCDEFSGLSAFAETADQALQDIRMVVAESIALLTEKGRAVPQPLSRYRFTGKLSLKMSTAEHRQLTLEALRRGVPLEKFIKSKLLAA